MHLSFLFNLLSSWLQNQNALRGSELLLRLLLGSKLLLGLLLGGGLLGGLLLGGCLLLGGVLGLREFPSMLDYLLHLLTKLLNVVFTERISHTMRLCPIGMRSTDWTINSYRGEKKMVGPSVYVKEVREAYSSAMLAKLPDVWCMFVRVLHAGSHTMLVGQAA